MSDTERTVAVTETTTAPATTQVETAEQTVEVELPAHDTTEVAVAPEAVQPT